MAARRFWPATKLGWLNAVLALVLIVSGVKYHKELHWARVQIDDYRQGYIESPLERELYLEARRQLHRARQPDEAMALLKESIRIDPNTDAVFLLAETYRSKGELKQAAQAYERSLKSDYLHIRARQALVATYRRLGKLEQARQTAAAGAALFRAMVREYQPVMDDTVDEKFNSKSRQVYGRYAEAWRTFSKLAEQPE